MKFGWSNFYRSNFPGNFPLLEINQGVVKDASDASALACFARNDF